MSKRVLDFIKSFTYFGEAVSECFLCGNCYWFAVILCNRFSTECRCYITYDVIANHFGCNIDGKVYDISGEVTKTYKWEKWEWLVQNYDPLVIRRIYRDCINK